MVIVLLILLVTIHHCLIFMHQLPLDWTYYDTKSKATHNA
jgi:acyl-CoA thioesterase